MIWEGHTTKGRKQQVAESFDSTRRRAFDRVRPKPDTTKNTVQITLNGEPFEIERPLSLDALLA